MSDELVAASLLAARPAALRRAERLLGGDRAAAEDVVSDVIGRLWERARASETGYSQAYVLSSVRNAVTDRWRRLARERDSIPSVAAAAPETDDESRTVIRLEVARLLAHLDHRQRRLLTLRYLRDLPQAAVASHLCLPQGSVASGTARALHRLRAVAGSPGASHAGGTRTVAVRPARDVTRRDPDA